MDSIQHEALQRMFINRRLCPWVPDHALFIKAEIAKLEVLEPHDADSFRAFYDKSLAEYEAKNAPLKEEPKADVKEEVKEEVVEPVVLPEEEKAEVVKEPKKAKEPKKKII